MFILASKDCRKGKAVVSLLVPVLFLSLLSYGIYFFVNQKNTNTYPEDTSVSLQADPDDTDGDGLLDWQEELYGTSKKLRDTDGDRVTDAQEIAQGHNPLIYGEGLNDENVIPQNKIFLEPEFAVFPSEGISTQQEFSQNQTTGAEGNSREVLLRAEINTLAVAVRNNYTEASQDTDLFNKLFLRDPDINVDPIKEIIARYRFTSKVIVEDIVYQELSLEARALGLGFLGVAETLEILIDSQGVTDQEYSRALQEYVAASLELQETILSIHNYVKGRSITFSDDEPGSFFLFAL